MPGLSVLTIDTSQMLVAMAVGHQLAQHPELAVPDVLDQPFPGGSNLDPEWLRFWTLDEHRGGPPAFTDHRVETGEKALQVVASGRAIATIPATIANGRPHPGVASIPLSDGRRPRLASSGVTTTRIRPPHALVDLAADLTFDPPNERDRRTSRRQIRSRGTHWHDIPAA